MTEPTPSALDAFERVFKDVLRQQAFLNIREQDRVREQANKKVFYAIDSNIVAFMCNPVGDALSGDGRILGVGEVFHDDTKERKEDIAASLAYFLSFSLDCKFPFIVFPPMDSEIRSIAEYYRGAVFSPRPSSEGARNYSADDILRQFINRINETGTSITTDQVHSLRDALLMDADALRVLGRLTDLLRKQRFMRSDLAASHPALPATLRAAIRPATDVATMIDVSVRKRRWLEAFNEIGRMPSPRLEHDAEALARVRVANSRLRALGDHDTTLVYLTLDTSILGASRVYSDDEIKEFKPQVRHPRMFLDEPDVLRPKAVNARKIEAGSVDGSTMLSLRDLFLVLIGGFFEDPERLLSFRAEIDLNDAHRKAIHDLFLQFQKEGHGNGLERLRNGWENYETAHSKEPPSSAIDRLRVLLEQEGAQNIVNQVEVLLKEIKVEQSKAWGMFWDANIFTRFTLQSVQLQGQKSIQPRDVPLLCFEQRDHLVEFLNKAKRWMSEPNTFDVGTYLRLREQMLEEDSTGYSDTLAHSYLFALHMQWKSAAILASRAKEIAAEHGNMEPGGANGREAWYFEAFCRRHAKVNQAELPYLLFAVKTAQRIADKEVDAHNTLDPGIAMLHPHDAVFQRYKAEELAIAMTDILMTWHRHLKDGASHAEDHLQPLQGLVTQLQELLNELVEVWRKVDKAPPLPDGHKYLLDKNYRMKILDQTILRLIRNILAISLQVPTLHEMGREAWKTRTKEHMERLARNDRAFEYLDSVNSVFTEIVYLCSEYRYGDETSDRKFEIRKKMDAKMNDIANNDSLLYIFPYDKARYLDIIKKSFGH